MLSARLTQYYGRLLRPPGTHPLSGLPVIGHAAPATPSAGHRAGEGLSSSRRHHRYVPRPIRRGVLGRLHFQVFRAFPGLRPDPFPDRAASLLPGLLAATRTGLPPAGDDELYGHEDRLPRTHSHSSRPAGRTPDLVQVVVQVGLEPLDRHPVHAGAPLFALTFSQAFWTAHFEISNGLSGDFNSFTRLLPNPNGFRLIERIQPQMTRPLRSTPITGASPLLRAGPPAEPATVLTPMQRTGFSLSPLANPNGQCRIRPSP